MRIIIVVTYRVLRIKCLNLCKLPRIMPGTMAITQKKKKKGATVIYKMGLIMPTLWESCGEDWKTKHLNIQHTLGPQQSSIPPPLPSLERGKSRKQIQWVRVCESTWDVVGGYFHSSHGPRTSEPVVLSAEPATLGC